MNVAFNKKITEFSYQNSGLNVPIGSLYNFQSAIVSRDEMKQMQPYIIANIHNSDENLRVGLLTSVANLTFRLLPPSIPFIRPIKDFQDDYIFYNYLQVLQIITADHKSEPLSKFAYLLGDAPKLYSVYGLREVKFNHLQENVEYIIVDNETMDMYRCKFIYFADTGVSKGPVFEFELDKLPFKINIIIKNISFSFYLNTQVSLNRLSEVSMMRNNISSLNVDNGMMVNRQKTLRWVERQSRKQSMTKRESCVTILIVAHGFMYKNVKMDRAVMKNVNISLMGGGSAIYGLGGNIIDPYVSIPSIDGNDGSNYTVTGNRRRTEMSIDLISQIYPSLLNKYNEVNDKKCSKQFFSIFKDIVSYLKTFYSATGIYTFPKQGDDRAYYKERRKPFSIFTTFNEKILYFLPNPYENCVNSEIKKKEDCVLIEPENKRELSFGLSMLQSSDPTDFDYTLAGISVNGGNYKTANLTNWNQHDVRDYWASKLLENTSTLSNKEQEYYFNLYNIISHPLDPVGTYDERTNVQGIELSQLIKLFKVGMGFTHVNIIDYSCNSCESYLSDLNRSVIDVVGSHPTMKLHREIKTKIRSTMKNPERVIMSLKNPSTQQIIKILGEKAKSTSYDKYPKGTRGRTIKRKSYGGKIKNKNRNKNKKYGTRKRLATGDK
jgi:hypothetical protein